jgi:hypothetical protein
MQEQKEIKLSKARFMSGMFAGSKAMVGKSARSAAKILA